MGGHGPPLSWIWREPSAVRHIAARRGGLQKGIQLVVLHVDRHTFTLRILGRNRETVALWTQEESLTLEVHGFPIPIGSMYGIYTNIGGILMVNVTIYGIHGSYGI